MCGRKYSEKLVLRNMDYISDWANICHWLLLANRETPFYNPSAMLNCSYVMVTDQYHVTCLVLFPDKPVKPYSILCAVSVSLSVNHILHVNLKTERKEPGWTCVGS